MKCSLCGSELKRDVIVGINGFRHTLYSCLNIYCPMTIHENEKKQEQYVWEK